MSTWSARRRRAMPWPIVSDSGSRTGLLDGTSRDCFSRIAVTRSVDLEPTVRAALHMHARGRGGGRADAHLARCETDVGYRAETS